MALGDAGQNRRWWAFGVLAIFGVLGGGVWYYVSTRNGPAAAATEQESAARVPQAPPAPESESRELQGIGTDKPKSTDDPLQESQKERDQSIDDASVMDDALQFASMSIPRLAANSRAMDAGRNLFQANCAQCHGSGGGGATGSPNLADQDWQWGGDPDTVMRGITRGRVAAMPPWREVIGAQGVDAVVEYVQTLSGQPADAALAASGKVQFETLCSACHGRDGKGMTAVGAPNLTDNVWLYGGDVANLKQTVESGRNGQCPAFGDRLGVESVRLLAAYVIHLSHEGR